MVVGFELEFVLLFLEVIHERAVKSTTTYPFPCMIFEFCRSAGVPVRHINVLKTATSTVGIDLIRDEANELAPNRGHGVELQPLGENLAVMVEHA